MALAFVNGKEVEILDYGNFMVRYMTVRTHEMGVAWRDDVTVVYI